MNLAGLLEKKRVLICCGSGGVGKTSVSAALGLLAARQGRKALVLTVDPARRLATALGMDLADNAETPVPAEAFRAAGIEPKGSFHAMMLNAKKTFDDIVERYAPSPEVRDTIFRNSAYVHGSVALTGSPEYMAVEKLHELYYERDYDLIIVDTPPLKHALDFLTAPRRFRGLLTENPLIRILVAAVGSSGRRSSMLSRLGQRSLFSILAVVTGEKAIEDAVEFFKAFSNLMGGFTGRYTAVEDLFRGEECGLLVVTSPNLITVEEALFLHRKVQGYGMRPAGFIVNRCQPDYLENAAPALESPPAGEAIEAAARAAGVSPQLVETLVETLRRQVLQRRAEEKNIALLARELLPEEFLERIPELPHDVHDLKGLAEIGRHLLP